MKPLRFLSWPLAALCLSTVPVFAEEPDPAQIEISVGRLLEQGHYSRKKLDDKVSQQLLKNYLEGLDYNHLFFTQSDVDGFTKKYATTLDDDILLGNPEAAYAIYDVYKKHVEDRVASVKELLKKDYEFKSDRMVEINRQKAAWPKNQADADKIWADRVEGELLQETLNSQKPPAKVKVPAADGASAPVETDEKGEGGPTCESAHAPLRSTAAQPARADERGRDQDVPHGPRANL